MSNVYERLKQLCEEKGVSAYRMFKDTGMQPSIMTDLKMGRKKTLSLKSMAKVADYFDVPINYLAGDVEDYISLKGKDKSYLKDLQDGFIGVRIPTESDALRLTADDFSELADMWNTMHDRAELNVLYKAARTATKEQIEQTSDFLNYLKKTAKD